jgi:putative SbcD/Mre11-related phosphoesterase
VGGRRQPRPASRCKSGSTTWPGCYALGGWQLTPERGAIHVGERTAVIADVHLGYEWARGAAGDCIPAHSLAETLESLELLLGRARIDRLVVAGDLVETPRPCRRTAAELGRLGRWLDDREISLVAILGNHDRSLSQMFARKPGDHATPPPTLAETLEVAGWTIAHGHRPASGARSIIGHHHPALKLAGRTTPCFLIGPKRIMLPAFSRNAAGCDLAAARLPEPWRDSTLRCLVSTGQELLDFGPIETLGSRLQASVNSM